MPRFAFVLSVVLGLAACVSGSQPGGVRIDPNVITRGEIEEEGPSSAWELVQKLRPAWIRGRGSTSFTQETDAVVYLDGTRMGGPDELRTIDTANIERIEFLDARRATVRFGAGHVQGAILVVTRR